MIERVRVRILAGAVGEFSSPELTLCADSSSVSIPPLCYHSGMQKTLVILQYILDPTKWGWADYAAVQA